jgi:hypothetical protein
MKRGRKSDKTKSKKVKKSIISPELSLDLFSTPKEEPDEIEFKTPNLSSEQTLTGEEEFFISIFTDYPKFVKYLKGICKTSNDCYCELITSLNFNFTVFTTGAPKGYSIFTEVNEELLAEPNRFYNAMLKLLKRIPRVNPSREREGKKVSLHKYMILIDRLIYYYNIYILKTENKIIPGFENNAGIVILYHGSYHEYDATIERTKINVPAPIENLFICTKAAPGKLACERTDDRGEDTEVIDSSNKNSYLWLMTDNIKDKGYVKYDEVAFKHKCAPPDDECIANCFLELSREGNAMEHYIYPTTKKYINKNFSRSSSENLYIVDLEMFYKIRDDPTMTDIEKLEISCITNTEFMTERLYTTLTEDKTQIASYHITMKDIVDFIAQELRKPNAFIYDRSCGSIKKLQKYSKKVDPSTGKIISEPIHTKITEVAPYIKQYTDEGFGIKKMKHHKRKSKKNRKSNRKTRRKTKRIENNKK